MQKSRKGRTIHFGFRLSQDERRMLASLAELFLRSQSDSVRLLIRDAYDVLYDNDVAQTDNELLEVRK